MPTHQLNPLSDFHHVVLLNIFLYFLFIFSFPSLMALMSSFCNAFSVSLSPPLESCFFLFNTPLMFCCPGLVVGINSDFAFSQPLLRRNWYNPLCSQTHSSWWPRSSLVKMFSAVDRRLRYSKPDVLGLYLAVPRKPVCTHRRYVTASYSFWFLCFVWLSNHAFGKFWLY